MSVPRNERVSAKFRAAHRYIREFSKENSKLNETRYFSVSFKRFVLHDRAEHKVVGKRKFVDGLVGIFHSCTFGYSCGGVNIRRSASGYVDCERASKKTLNYMLPYISFTKR